MFPHYMHQLECSRSLEGHQTPMVHECLQVAAALGCYHRWQHQVNHQEKSENADWKKVPTVPKGDFQYKYSLALVLLGSAQKPSVLPTLNFSDTVTTTSTIVGSL